MTAKKPGARARCTAEEAWARFKSEVEAMGGTVLEPAWLGARIKHHVICAQGHDCRSTPDKVQQGYGFCRTCAGRDSDTAWAEFKARVEAQGGIVLEPKWLGCQTQHHVRCANGHDCYPLPLSIHDQGICRRCYDVRRATVGWAEFKARIEALNGIVLEPKWLGARVLHRVRCANGHDRLQRPSNLPREKTICQKCYIDRLQEGAWDAFKTRVEEMGGTVLEANYLGVLKPHHVRCAQEHDRWPIPHNVFKGRGICGQCAGKIFDVFYVVTGPAGLKLGITSGDHRPRLADHRRDGYHGDGDPDRLWNELPDGIARKTEKLVLAQLKAVGYKPIWHDEYFDIEVLPVVLGIVDRELAWYTPVIGPGQEEAATTGIESLKRIVA